MTAILGLRGDREIVIAADSGLTLGDRVIAGARKIVRRRSRHGDMLVAAAGPWRACQCVFAAAPPTPSKAVAPADWLAGPFLSAIRGALADEPGGAAQAAAEGLELMVALQDRLFIVDAEGGVIEPEIGFAAIGSGAGVALGAFHVGGNARNAMEVAAQHVVGIREPFIFECLRVEP